MANDMGVTWHREALEVYELLGASEGFEDLHRALAAHVRRLEADPGRHRVGAEHRWVGSTKVWFVVEGPPHERWMLWWTAPEPGSVLIQGLERLG